MKTVEVHSGQSIWDIALQEYGDVSCVEWLMEDNQLSLCNYIPASTILKIRDTAKNRQLVSYYKSRMIVVSSDVEDIFLDIPYQDQLLIHLTNRYNDNLWRNRMSSVMPAVIIGGVEAVAAAGAYIDFEDLSDIVILEYKGSSIPTKSGNRINYTAGTIHYLKLSDNSEFWFNGHLLSSSGGAEIINDDGIVFTLNPEDKIPSVFEALNNGYIELPNGAQIVRPVGIVIDENANVAMDQDENIVVESNF